MLLWLIALTKDFETPMHANIMGQSAIGKSHIVLTILDALPQGFFDYVVHDPPRLTHAGHLYGMEFYAKLFRILRRGGKLFHYTGEPGSRRRRIDLRRGVMHRLRQAGFENTVYHENVRGVTCRKPNP